MGSEERALLSLVCHVGCSLLMLPDKKTDFSPSGLYGRGAKTTRFCCCEGGMVNGIMSEVVDARHSVFRDQWYVPTPGSFKLANTPISHASTTYILEYEYSNTQISRHMLAIKSVRTAIKLLSIIRCKMLPPVRAGLPRKYGEPHVVPRRAG